jgi:hypothetical protein
VVRAACHSGGAVTVVLVTANDPGDTTTPMSEDRRRDRDLEHSQRTVGVADLGAQIDYTRA